MNDTQMLGLKLLTNAFFNLTLYERLFKTTSKLEKQIYASNGIPKPSRY
jgi:hypothetical protein